MSEAQALFNVGETVHWTSQAGGSIRTKQGAIAEVVPVGQRPSRMLFPQLYKGEVIGSPRKTVSYVVLVKGVPYWPHVAPLRAGPLPGSEVSASSLPALNLKEGEAVCWTSQAGGNTRTKNGTVAQVVAAKQYPDRERFPLLFSSSGVGLSRDHESYVVLVGKKPYWPRAIALRRPS